VWRIDDASERGAIDAIADWVRSNFRSELASRPSLHRYVRTLPAEAIAIVDAIRRSDTIVRAIRAEAPPGSRIVPLEMTDEVYLSHYNKDLGGDHGLFARHYDGNLRFLPVGSVVRALVYVRSNDRYNVVFADSGLAHRFVSYEIGLLDFHRELHWVEGEYAPGDERIVLKCNYLLVAPSEWLLEGPLKALNLGQFYVIKAAMEYSKSPRTVPERIVGIVCNAMRVLNNLHPVLPYLALVLAGTIALAPFL
jgi:hypothetical protein